MNHPCPAPNIVALGGMNMALIGTAERLPHPGETLRGERFYTAPGGKGATQAVAAARLGANVKMIGRVGKDMFGPRLLDALKNDGIDVTGVAEDPDHPSGVGMIVLNAERQNHVLAIYGANLRCNEDQLAAVEAALGRRGCSPPTNGTPLSPVNSSRAGRPSARSRHDVGPGSCIGYPSRGVPAHRHHHPQSD